MSENESLDRGFERKTGTERARGKPEIKSKRRETVGGREGGRGEGGREGGRAVSHRKTTPKYPSPSLACILISWRSISRCPPDRPRPCPFPPSCGPGGRAGGRAPPSGSRVGGRVSCRTCPRILTARWSTVSHSRQKKEEAQEGQCRTAGCSSQWAHMLRRREGGREGGRKGGREGEREGGKGVVVTRSLSRPRASFSAIAPPCLTWAGYLWTTTAAPPPRPRPRPPPPPPPGARARG
jgi:hypothetical protein